MDCSGEILVKGVKFAVLVGVLVVIPTALRANPIPIPQPASMPLEEMRITIGADRRVDFTGDFTFDFIPTDVTKMLFPLPPENPSNVEVFQDSVPLSWNPVPDTYPTVLPEYPTLPMFEWLGPFPEGGAVFTVNYEHDLFQRDNSWIFFYSLGTGKYFPTYDKITTAIFEIDLPDNLTLKRILLDNTPVDPSLYTLTGSRLDMTLTSQFGPFTKDLIVELEAVTVPEPTSTLGFLSLVTLGAASTLKRKLNCPKSAENNPS
jgi:hypothetical protein